MKAYCNRLDVLYRQQRSTTNFLSIAENNAVMKFYLECNIMFPPFTPEALTLITTRRKILKRKYNVIED